MLTLKSEQLHENCNIRQEKENLKYKLQNDKERRQKKSKIQFPNCPTKARMKQEQAKVRLKYK